MILAAGPRLRKRPRMQTFACFACARCSLVWCYNAKVSRAICVALFIRFKSTIDLWSILLGRALRKREPFKRLTKAESNKRSAIMKRQLKQLIEQRLKLMRIFFFYIYINFTCSINSADVFSVRNKCAQYYYFFFFFSCKSLYNF